jgi:hypothetical protein
MNAVANFHLRGTPPAASIVETLRKLDAIPAYTAEGNGWSSLFPALGERADADGVFALTRALSEAFHSSVLGFLIDGEAFRFWLFDGGRAVEAYSSLDPGTADPASLLPLCRPGVTLTDLAEVLHEKKTQLQADVRTFLAEWQKHRRDLRAHLLKTEPKDVVSLMKEFDERSSQMNEESPSDPAELAADFGDLLGLANGLARLDHGSIDEGRGPLDATLRIE